MAKKKRRKAPAQKPAAPKRVRRQMPAPARVRGAAPAAKRRQASPAARLQSGLTGWIGGQGMSGYDGRDWGSLALLVSGLGVILLSAFTAGGYFLEQRSYAELIILWLLLVGLLFGLQSRDRMPRLGRIETGFFAGYTVWMLLSVVWSLTPSLSFDEFVRGLLYLAGFGIFYLYLKRREWLGWLGTVFVVVVAVVAIDALLGKTLPNVFNHPDPFHSNRLNYPITYWNTMALFMAMGFIIGLRSLADRASGLLSRCFFAPVMFLFLVVIWFTLSRAGLALLAAGIGLYLLLAASRLRALMQTVLLVLLAGIAILISYATLPNMVAAVPDPVKAVGEGHILGLVLLLLMAVAAGSQYVIRLAEERVTLTQAAGRKIGYGLAVAGAAVVLLGGVYAFGVKIKSPEAWVQAQWRAVTHASGDTIPQASQDRLLSLQSLRFKEYGVSLKRFSEHPLLGTGAATWDLAWLRYRPALVGADGHTQVPSVKNGHSLFFDTMTELGLVGTVLLVGFVVTFFVAAIRDLRFMKKGRDRELYGAFFATASIFLVHSMIDWDWQMPVVTLAFFMFAGGLLRYGMLARSDRGGEASGEDPAAEPAPGSSRWPRFLRWNWLLGYAGVLAMAATILPLLSSNRLDASNQEAMNGDYAAVSRDASLAHKLDPLDAQPLVMMALARQGEALPQGQGTVNSAKLTQAVDLLNQAHGLEPDNYEIYQDLTRIYLQLYAGAKQKGDQGAMKEYVEKASESVYWARYYDPLEYTDTGKLEDQVRQIGGLRWPASKK